MLEVAIALIVLLALDLYTASVAKSRGRYRYIVSRHAM